MFSVGQLSKGSVCVVWCGGGGSLEQRWRTINGGSVEKKRFVKSSWKSIKCYFKGFLSKVMVRVGGAISLFEL